MQTEDFDWNDLKLFLAIKRAGNLTSAAKELGIHHSTAFRRLNEFEDKAKTRLFDRRPAGYVLTESGRRIMADVNQMDRLGEQISSRLAGDQNELTGRLMVTFPATLSLDTGFMEALAEFAETYPGIRLDLNASYAPVDLEKFEADIAVRFTNDPPPALIGRKLGQIRTAVFERRDITAANREKWVTCYSKEFSQDAPRAGMRLLEVSDGLTQLQTVRAGLGQGRLPLHQAALYPDLVRIGEDVPQEFLEVWLLYHPDQKDNEALSLFARYMRRVITDSDLFAAA